VSQIPHGRRISAYHRQFRLSDANITMPSQSDQVASLAILLRSAVLAVLRVAR